MALSDQQARKRHYFTLTHAACFALQLLAPLCIPVLGSHRIALQYCQLGLVGSNLSRIGGRPKAHCRMYSLAQEAFGLYSTALGAGRTNPNQPPTANNRPVTPVDPYIPRTELIEELKKQYDAVQN